MACGVSLKRKAGRSGGLGYSFRAILRQSSQRFSVNCWPRSGIAPQNLQTPPSARHKSAHVLFFFTLCGVVSAHTGIV